MPRVVTQLRKGKEGRLVTGFPPEDSGEEGGAEALALV